MKAAIFNIERWYDKRYDGRKKIFRGITKEEFNIAVNTHNERNLFYNRWPQTEWAKRREIIQYFSKIPYIYEGDGLDDYNHYQRPCSNGIGYVSICPGERGNNYYVDDPLVVSYLKKKYDKYMKSQTA